MKNKEKGYAGYVQFVYSSKRQEIIIFTRKELYIIR